MSSISELLEGSKNDFIKSFENLRTRTQIKQKVVSATDTDKVLFETPDNCWRWSIRVHVNSNNFNSTFVNVDINGQTYKLKCNSNSAFSGTDELLFEGFPYVQKSDKITISNTTLLEMTIQLAYDTLIKKGS